MEDKFNRRRFVYYLIVCIPMMFIIIVSVFAYKFIPKMYQVVFDSDGGSVVDSVMVEKNSKVNKPEDPVKKGSSFTGWYYNNELYNFDNPVTQDIVLKAHWIANVNTISLDIPDSEIQALESDVWNYMLEDTYTIKGENDVYKVQGSITKQNNVNGFSGSQKTGYYFAFSVRPAEIKDGLEIKIPNGNNNEYNTFYKKDLVEQQLTVLFSIKNDNSGDKSFDIIVDLDGSGSDEDKPTKIKIDYSELELINVYDVTFQYPNENKVVKVVDGMKVTSPVDEPKEDYHEFIYWQKGKDRYNFDLPVTEDIVLIPHWRLDIDKFINDSVNKFNVNEKVQNKINVSKSNNIMTYNILQEKIPLTDFVESNFSDDIYNVLKKGEITEIDLKYDDNHIIQLTSEDNKDIIVSKINELLKQITGNNDNSNFDDLMNLDDHNFDLIIAKYTDNIDLININQYVIDFVCDFRLVDTEEELNKALANNEVKKVKLDSNIPISNTIIINRNVEIDGAEYAIDAQKKDNNKYALVVNHDVAIIDNIKLNNATISAILVETEGNVIAKNLDVSGSGEAGVEVHGKFTYKNDLDSEKLKYNEEIYKKPSIRIPKSYTSNAVVNMNNSYRVENYIKAIRQDDDFSDRLTYTGDTNYYTMKNNSRYYVIAFEDADRYETYVRLRSYGEDIVLPKGGEKEYGEAVGMNIDGRNYIFDGWSTIRGYKGTNSGGKVMDYSNITKGDEYQLFFYAINSPLN